MKVLISREKRKSIVLKIEDSQTATLKAPLKMKDEVINKFLASKNRWLAKHASALAAQENFAQSFDFEKFVYIDGKSALQTNSLMIDFDKQKPAAKAKAIKKHYLSLFSSLVDFVQEISEKTGLCCSEVKPLDSVRVWGNFSASKQMKLNFKLVMLPKRLAYYVICHELCHGLHMNHKVQFWADLQKICPDYKKLKKELSAYSFVLRHKFV